MPFAEEGGQEMLANVLKRGLLEVETSPKLLSECKFQRCLGLHHQYSHRSLDCCGRTRSSGFGSIFGHR